MVKAMVSALLVVMVARSTSAPQTAQELAAKYPVVSYYEVRPGVLMEPRYSADGQICGFRLFAKQAMPKMNNFDLRLRDKTIEGILADLVPVDMRSQRAKDFGMLARVGKVSNEVDDYENVFVEKMFTDAQTMVIVQIKSRSCPQDQAPRP